MIPKPPVTGCPPGTFNGMHTCFCDDHCSWETCRLINPPFNCLSSISHAMVWARDEMKDAWVAQGNIEKTIELYL